MAIVGIRGAKRVLCFVFFVVLGMTGCSELPVESPNDTTTAAGVVSEAPRRYVRRHTNPAPHLVERVNAAKAKAAWVGESHRKAMATMHANEHVWKGRLASNRAAVCRLLEDIAEQAMRDAESAMQTTSPELIRREYAKEIVRKQRICRPPAPASVFSLPSATEFPSVSRVPFSHSAALVTEDTVLWQFGPYAQAIESDINAYEAHESPVVFVISDDVLYDAASDGVSDEDLIALAGTASLAVSSAEEWEVYDFSGYPYPDPIVDPAMVFAMRPAYWKYIFRLIGADVAGCIAGAQPATWGALWVLATTPVGTALAGACGVMGGVASAAYLGSLVTN